MSDTTTLMTANLLDVFNERDPEKRRAAIARTYADDVRWAEGDDVSVGKVDLDTRAAALQDKIGPLQFIAAEPVRQAAGFGLLAWHLVAPGDDTPQASGFDAAIIRDGVIAELYTVLT